MTTQEYIALFGGAIAVMVFPYIVKPVYVWWCGIPPSERKMAKRNRKFFRDEMQKCHEYFAAGELDKAEYISEGLVQVATTLDEEFKLKAKHMATLILAKIDERA